MIGAENLTKYYGEKSLFEQVNISLSPSERVGLVGNNGSGKSTLGRILAGQEESDVGSIARRRGAARHWRRASSCIRC